ncbi:MAG: hypothetical protein LBO78_01505 [Rickettsiales bacterium]|jgi:hypothetical protein|nr:hypothetical protein [Rickettsiales bacterium]
MSRRIGLLAFAVFLFVGGLSARAQNSGARCPYAKAALHFENPTVVLGEYGGDFYCSDILYLQRMDSGIRSVAEYRALYPPRFRANFEALRAAGITPDILEDFDDIDDAEFAENPGFAGLMRDAKGVTDYVMYEMQSGRVGDHIVINDAAYEDENRSYSGVPGDILERQKKRSCLKDVPPRPRSGDPAALASPPTYYEIIAALPYALRPIALEGSTLVNAMGTAVATIEMDTVESRVAPRTGALAGTSAESKRVVRFEKAYFPRAAAELTATVTWNHDACGANSLYEMVEAHSICRMCPYALLIFNEISYLFDFMYRTFRFVIISFLILFGCFYFATTFLKGLKDLPFAVKFSDYPKDIAKKLRMILVAAVIAVLPPKVVFSFTLELIIDVAIGVSDEVLKLAGNNKTSDCDAGTIVDRLNADKLKRAADRIIPPVVKDRHYQALSTLTGEAPIPDEVISEFASSAGVSSTEARRRLSGAPYDDFTSSYVLSKETVGGIICFLADTIQSNGKQKAMGEILMRNSFGAYKGTEANKTASFIMGIVVWGIFFMINLMISFYILDAFIGILEMAILWPFMVLGYAFEVVGFNMGRILETAKKFAFTMIMLAVFSVFNIAMIHGFLFVNGGGGGDTLLGLLDAALAANKPEMIVNAIPVDFLSISKFLFIIYAMYYVYSQLDVFSESYGMKGSVDRPIGNAIRKLFDSSIATARSVSRSEPTKMKEEPAKVGAPATGDKDKVESEETETTEDTEVTNA